MSFARDDIERGLAAYARERETFRRLLRRYGEFTEHDFDRWFRAPKRRRRGCFQTYSADTFILGAGLNGGTLWAARLHLLQIMAALGEVRVSEHGGTTVYGAP